MKSLIFGILVILIAGMFVFIGRFVLGGPEDSWICQNGEWVKHGNPSLPAPVVICK